MPQAHHVAQAMDRAAASFAAGRLDESWSLCEHILREDPAHFFALHLASVIAARRGDWEACLAFATRALRVMPGHPEVLANRGAALRNLRRWEEALADYDAALAAAPRSADAHNNRGAALAALGRHEEALAAYDRALATAPAAAEAHYNRGVSLAALNRHAEAVASYSRAIELKPNDSRGRWNRGLSRLALGDYANGFVDYEARLARTDTELVPRRFAQPAWNGRQDLAGRTILLHAEQGIGDCIQFSRFARALHERGARVVLEAHPPIAPLLAALPSVDATVAAGSELPDFNYHCPLPSLPALLGTRLEHLPPQDPPLHPPAEWLERWRARLGEQHPPRIGIFWSGGTGAREDDPRSIPLDALAPVLGLPATFVCLQREVRARDREALAAKASILHFEGEIEDFRDTAALVALTDLVVTVDTSVAHLAGAMAHPAWILLPFAADWRWLLDRDDSPWYPSARLFRQALQGDWAPVIDRVARALRERFAMGPD